MIAAAGPNRDGPTNLARASDGTFGAELSSVSAFSSDLGFVTTLLPRDWRCTFCEEVSRQTFVMSTNELAPGDLDLRPGEMARSTMPYWVIRCPTCGAVQDQSAEEEEVAFHDMVVDAGALISSDTYRFRLEDPAYPELANLFRCRALLAESVRRFSEAGWAELRAAWVCDDADEADAARRCRERALHWWYCAEVNKQAIAEEFSSTQLLLADVLRRVAAFEPARERCTRGLSGRPDEPVRSLLEYELELISREDVAAHSISEVAGA